MSSTIVGYFLVWSLQRRVYSLTSPCKSIRIKCPKPLYLTKNLPLPVSSNLSIFDSVIVLIGLERQKEVGILFKSILFSFRSSRFFERMYPSFCLVSIIR